MVVSTRQLFLVVFFWMLALREVQSNLVILKSERWVDLSSHIVRVVHSFRIQNAGTENVTEVILAFPTTQVEKLVTIQIFSVDGKDSRMQETIEQTDTQRRPNTTFYSVSLTKEIEGGKSITMEMLATFARALKFLPEEISQLESQLAIYGDTAYLTSPYPVKLQSLLLRVVPGKVKSYTKIDRAAFVQAGLRYGPFEEQPVFSFLPITVHFEAGFHFVVAEELVREIEISHWGNVQVTEHYNLFHAGVRLKHGFSRLRYQYGPIGDDAPSVRTLVAILPPSAHSVYYRDELGNISTSHLRGDSQKIRLEMHLRFPLFGGWKTTFTVGYSLPLHNFLFESDSGKNGWYKVVLPEDSKDISSATTFLVKKSQDVKYSHLDIVGRPVVVLRKDNVIPEDNLYFQVYYNFYNIYLLRKPMMLVVGIFLLFAACIVYMHTDLTISKNSPSYLQKLQWEEVQATVQHIEDAFNRCLTVHDKLESSQWELFCNGDALSFKEAWKVADAQFKELAKEVNPLMEFLRSCSQASFILPKIEELIAKEKGMQEMEAAIQKILVECSRKKLSGKDVESRITSQQRTHVSLKQEVKGLLDYIADF